MADLKQVLMNLGLYGPIGGGMLTAAQNPEATSQLFSQVAPTVKEIAPLMMPAGIGTPLEQAVSGTSGIWYKPLQRWAEQRLPKPPINPKIPTHAAEGMADDVLSKMGLKYNGYQEGIADIPGGHMYTTESGKGTTFMVGPEETLQGAHGRVMAAYKQSLGPDPKMVRTAASTRVRELASRLNLSLEKLAGRMFGKTYGDLTVEELGRMETGLRGQGR